MKLAEEFYLWFDYIDMGGGFFGGKVLPGKPLMKEYANTIVSELKEKFDPDKVTLMIEPGRQYLQRRLTMWRMFQISGKSGGKGS